jgi:hypothetical protein
LNESIGDSNTSLYDNNNESYIIFTDNMEAIGACSVDIVYDFVLISIQL